MISNTNFATSYEGYEDASSLFEQRLQDVESFTRSNHRIFSDKELTRLGLIIWRLYEDGLGATDARAPNHQDFEPIPKMVRVRPEDDLNLYIRQRQSDDDQQKISFAKQFSDKELGVLSFLIWRVHRQGLREEDAQPSLENGEIVPVPRRQAQRKFGMWYKP